MKKKPWSKFQSRIIIMSRLLCLQVRKMSGISPHLIWIHHCLMLFFALVFQNQDLCQKYVFLLTMFKHVLKKDLVSTETRGFDRSELLATFALSVLSENLSFTTGYSALIFTQTLTKDNGGHHFLILSQAPTLKHNLTPLQKLWYYVRNLVPRVCFSGWEEERDLWSKVAALVGK